MMQASDQINTEEMQTEDQSNVIGDENNPSTMDIRIVMKMLSELKVQIRDGIKEEVAVNSSKDTASADMLNKVTELTSKLMACEVKQKYMVDSMARMSDLIAELQVKK